MQFENAVAVDAGLAPHADTVGFRLQSALVGALHDSFPFCLGDCRKDGHHHPSHRSFSGDAVVQEADGHAVFVELLDQTDHVNSVASQPVEFLDQDNVAIFHLQLQRVEARATSAAPTYFEPAKIPTVVNGKILHSTDGAKSRCLIDGGVFVNNPALCAYAEAEKIKKIEHNYNEILLVSLGTGKATRSIECDKAMDLGDGLG